MFVYESRISLSRDRNILLKQYLIIYFAFFFLIIVDENYCSDSGRDKENENNINLK